MLKHINNFITARGNSGDKVFELRREESSPDHLDSGHVMFFHATHVLS
jgi:hypothetical protein